MTDFQYKSMLEMMTQILKLANGDIAKADEALEAIKTAGSSSKETETEN